MITSMVTLVAQIVIQFGTHKEINVSFANILPIIIVLSVSQSIFVQNVQTDIFPQEKDV
jgi:hypothetical protein